MKIDTSTYADRLQSAMEEMGYTSSNRGQTRIAEAVRCKPQAINQVLRGSSKELSAGTHSRVCVVLGIEALWLADGVGPKYRPPDRPPQSLKEDVITYATAEETLEMGVTPKERSLLLKMRNLSKQVTDALAVIVDMLARGPV